MNKIKSKFFLGTSGPRLNPPLVLALGFFVLIIIGALALSLPWVTQSGKATNFIDALFVSTSASCVTGLTPVNTADHWNWIGKTIIIVLIQIGGLGIMTLATSLFMVFRRKIGLESRMILSEQFNINSLSGLVRLIRYTLGFSFIVEGLGALLLAIRFSLDLGLKEGIVYGIFHSISAFCNAGFDIFGNSMVDYRGDFVVNIVIMGLVTIGGLGFLVNYDLYENKSLKKLSLHSRLVLFISGILTLGGGLGFFILEYSNMLTLGPEPLQGKVFISLFQSVVARTAGFFSTNLPGLRDQTVLLLSMLMFIGGSPGSTAGGIKTTTFGVLVLSCLATVKGQKEPEVSNRHVSSWSVSKALALTMIYLTLDIIVVFFISIIEDHNFIDIVYEVVSAFATVGASRGITSDLRILSKVLLIGAMYAGRLGPLTLAYVFTSRSKPKKTRFPEEDIPIG